jgi:hypothetical protein
MYVYMYTNTIFIHFINSLSKRILKKKTCPKMTSCLYVYINGYLYHFCARYKQVIERILKRTGYKMTSCTDGVQALKLLEDRGYLPDMVRDCVCVCMCVYLCATVCMYVSMHACSLWKLSSYSKSAATCLTWYVIACVRTHACMYVRMCLYMHARCGSSSKRKKRGYVPDMIYRVCMHACNHYMYAPTYTRIINTQSMRIL